MTDNEIERYQVLVLLDCPYCKAAVDLLKQQNKRFCTIVMDTDQPLLNFLKQKYNWKTVPIVVGITKESEEIVIGGFTDLQKFLEKS